MESEKKYIIDPKAILLPRRYLIKSKKKWVGIGGAITMPAIPPEKEYLVPEATEREYILISKTCPLVTAI